jgi:RNA polymerase sigma-70 factor (ECF subfamily)
MMQIQQNMADLEIIELILAGDKEAFRVLYHRYKRKYMLTSLRYIKSKSDAEDVVQDAFVQIYRDLYQFDIEKGNFSTWSNRIVINTCLQKLRKKSVLNVFTDIMEFGQQFSINAMAIEKLNLEDLTKLIQRLPKGYRTVFNLYVIDGYTHKEISNLLQISESTSKTQLMRAKKLLKTDLSKVAYVMSKNYG